MTLHAASRMLLSADACHSHTPLHAASRMLLSADAYCARWQPVHVQAGTLLDVLQTIGPCHSHMMLHA